MDAPYHRTTEDTLEVRLFRSITSIDVASWDCLAGENVLASHGWLRLVEEALVVPVFPYYVTASTSDGIVGATVCYPMQSSALFGNLDHILFGRFKGLGKALGLSMMPALICGPLYGYGAHLLASENLAGRDRELVVSRLLDSLESLGQENGLSLAFPGILEGESELVRQLTHRGFRTAQEIPVCILDLNFSGFEGYLDFIRAKRPKAANAIRREIKRNKKTGTRIRRLNELGDYGPEMHRVLDRQYQDYNGVPWMFRESFFRKAFEYLQEEISFYVTERAGQMTGCSVVLQRGRTGYCLFLGIARELTGKDFTYFNLMYHRIEVAISKGMGRLFFGRMKYDAKIRRGCHLEQVFILYRSRSSLKRLFTRGWFPVVTYRNRRIVSEEYWNYWGPGIGGRR